ncbi:MAG: hypothetical protein ABGX20_21210 [Bacillus sp. (in: firmicutes)]
MDIEKITKLSEQFITNQFVHRDSHVILQGSLPIMISAPHTVSQMRNGKAKNSESYTGVLATLLHKNEDFHAIIKTRNLMDDANYDRHSLYRDELISYINRHSIKLLIDLHVMHSSKANILEIATGNGKNIHEQWDLVNAMTTIAKSHGIDKIGIDHKFRALNPNCVSAHIADRCQIPTLQVEMNWGFIQLSKENPHGFKSIYEVLKNMAALVADEIAI